jgi:hypothetical protein
MGSEVGRMYRIVWRICLWKTFLVPGVRQHTAILAIGTVWFCIVSWTCVRYSFHRYRLYYSIHTVYVQRRYRTSSIDGRWHSNTVLVCKASAPSSILGPRQESLNLLGGLRWQGTWGFGLVSDGRKRLKNTYNSQTAHTHTHTYIHCICIHIYNDST